MAGADVRGWLPRFYATATCLAYFDGEEEGWLLGLRWLGVTIELTIARRTRTLCDQSDEVGA
ncbi:hypothetical protein [Sphingomonas sp.]|uniref:hypothetical protein n=1 Tax=Sphingomonas sp. TaxID=28214 RepID=UPI003CC57E83